MIVAGVWEGQDAYWMILLLKAITGKALVTVAEDVLASLGSEAPLHLHMLWPIVCIAWVVSRKNILGASGQDEFPRREDPAVSINSLEA